MTVEWPKMLQGVCLVYRLFLLGGFMLSYRAWIFETPNAPTP